MLETKKDKKTFICNECKKRLPIEKKEPSIPKFVSQSFWRCKDCEAKRRAKLNKEINDIQNTLSSSELEDLLYLLHRRQEELYHAMREDLDWCWTIDSLLELQKKLESLLHKQVIKEDWNMKYCNKCGRRLK